MAITTVEGFLEALEKSGLFSAEQLAQARQIASETSEVKALARRLIQKGWLSRWQAAQLLAGRTSVFFLGKYKLIEMLGRGGMGGVFLAEHTMMNRRVALKVVSKQIAQDPAALEQFLTEARAIAALDHPNIVRAYNVDCEDGRYYLVMEYVEGKDLQRLVEEEGPLDFQKVADYIRQAADGLAHAHQHQLIHCDIKPSNLLVTPEGVVKILDLGLARFASSVEGQKENQTDPRLLGTVDYQAPEVALGQKPDPRSDIYSLGCTMFFLLTGKAPFGEGSLHERILKHQTAPLPNIASLRPGVPKLLAAVCRKMMAKKPGDRFQSAEEISKLLAQWRPAQPKLRKAVPLEEPEASPPAGKTAASNQSPEESPSPSQGPSEETTLEAPASAPKLAGRLSQLPPWVWIASGAALVVVVGLVIVFLVLSTSSEPRSVAKRPVKPTGPRVVEEQGISFPIGGTSPAGPPTPPGPSDSPGSQPQEKPSAPSETQPLPKSEEKPEPSSWPGAKSEKPPASQQPPASEQSPKPKPEEKPQPKPKEKTQPHPKPSSKGQPSSKPAPQPPNPLAAFLDEKGNLRYVAKDLPELTAPPSEPVSKSLIKLPFEPTARWDLQLLGGNLVFKGDQQFLIRRRRTDTGIQWEVTFQKSLTERGTPIAQFEYLQDKHDLLFRWLPGADPQWANLLRNCAAEIAYRTDTVALFLRSPKQFPPMEFDPFKPIKPFYVELDYLPPHPDRFLVQFLPPKLKTIPLLHQEKYKPLEKAPQTNVVIEPAGATSPDPKKPILLKLLWKDRANNFQEGIVFHILTRPVGSRVRIEVRLVRPSLREFRQKRSLDEALQAINYANECKRRLDEDRAQKDPKKRLSEDNRKKLRELLDSYDFGAWFIKMQHVLEAGITLEYRLLYDLTKYQVLLGSSSGAPQEGILPKK